ncbi:MAG: hypothetical protein ACHQYP_02580 [Nitrospiria bacterium]
MGKAIQVEKMSGASDLFGKRGMNITISCDREFHLEIDFGNTPLLWMHLQISLGLDIPECQSMSENKKHLMTPVKTSWNFLSTSACPYMSAALFNLGQSR